MDTVELFEAVLQHAEPHGALHHIDALQLEVIDGVQAGYAAWAGFSQPQELLCRRGNGLAGWVEPEETISRARKITYFLLRDQRGPIRRRNVMCITFCDYVVKK